MKRILQKKKQQTTEDYNSKLKEAVHFPDAEGEKSE